MSPPPTNSPLLSFSSMEEKNTPEKVPSDDDGEDQDPEEDDTTGSTISNTSSLNSPVLPSVRFVTNLSARNYKIY